MGEIIERATNCRQYDREDLNWALYNSSSLNKKLFYTTLMIQIKSWKNKSVLEVGAGSGWLLDLALKGGAKLAEGIEPSMKNQKLAKESYKELILHNTTIENFKTSKKYDLIISILAFNHIRKVVQVFEKINSMLTDDGNLIIIVPDYYYAKTSRSGHELELEEMGNEEYAVMVKRRWETLADIIRKTSYYEQTAKEAGMKLIKELPLVPSEESIQANPIYTEFKSTTMHWLLIFGKTHV